jgi:hypothetical protein
MERCIHEIFKNVQECHAIKKMRLSGEVKSWMNKMLLSVFYRFVHGGVTMLEARQQKTLDDDDIRAVATMILIDNIAVDAVGHADTICDLYSRSRKKKEGRLLISPSRMRSMLIKGMNSYKKDVRIRPLTSVVLASILEYLVREIFMTVCHHHHDTTPPLHTLYKEDVLLAIRDNRSLFQTLCASGMLE